MNNHHASCVAVGAKGILIRGAPGSGKSTLALQLIDTQGYGLGRKLLRGQLVSDDQTMIQVKSRKLVASPPPALEGLLEIRGLGIKQLSFKKSVKLHILVDLVPATDLARMPEVQDLQAEIDGILLPRIAIAIGNRAAASVVRAALQLLE